MFDSTDLIVTLAFNILSVITSVALETPTINQWWKSFQYKRLAWLGGTLLLPGIIIGLVSLGMPLSFGVDNFVWDGILLWAVSSYSMYYSSQATYSILTSKV